MRSLAFRRVLTPALTLACLGPAVGAQSSIGIFDAHTDVGRAGRSGSTSYDPQRQEYLLAGSGQNMWNDRDDFHLVWKRMTGNFILFTRARFIGAGVEDHRKIGWTIRPSLATNSAHVTAALHGNGLMSLQFRRTTGGTTEEAKSPDSLPDPDAVIQLERRDGVYVMSVARFGDTLVTQQLAGVTLPDTVYVGLFVCAHNDTVLERAAFSNVRITRPAKRDFVPYRDYLGSNLEILDVATGHTTIVHQYRGSFQAPNWTRDGKALIYAQEGRLYRFDLSAHTAQVINTGFATSNNNDHVLSFDGRMLGISHHTAADSDASIIYTLPATGGTPRRVTAKGPSYLHGFSPDGRWLVYTGVRGDELDVYKIPVTGGDEIRLTSAPGLDDGPEFTPDGDRLLQFVADWTDAALAHATRRQRAGAGHQRRLQQLVPAHLARRQVDRVPRVSPGRGRRRSPVLPACAAASDARRWRAGARDRLCVWWTGNVQRPLVVARWHATRVREQFGGAVDEAGR